MTLTSICHEGQFATFHAFKTFSQTPFHQLEERVPPTIRLWAQTSGCIESCCYTFFSVDRKAGRPLCQGGCRKRFSKETEYSPLVLQNLDSFFMPDPQLQRIPEESREGDLHFHASYFPMTFSQAPDLETTKHDFGECIEIIY